MEHLRPTSFPESLKATLNCYQITSIDSLSGPSGFPALAAQMWFKENKQLPPIPPQPMVQIPYFIPSDKSAKRSETVLAGEKIACFIVGGEKRLCLPQILTSVLREYSIAEINQACGELHIYCSRCLPEQLEILKALGILPINTAQCGLITKTDAERLVALLTDQHEPMKKDQLPKDIDPESGFPVYHECFGRGYGKFYPKAYTSPGAQCVMCDDCGHLYSPQRFIAHSDRSFEKRTCHWGFDPENWRNYLLLPKNLGSVKREEFEKILDQMKARFEKSRFDPSGQPAPAQYTESPPTPNKRRYDSEQDSPSRKKIKEEDGKIFEPTFFPTPYGSLPYGAVPSVLRHSAFRPWSPGLSTMAGPNPSDAPAIQDVAHLKSLLPFTLDRRGFPQYIQTSRPLVLGTRTELPAPPSSSSSSSIGAVRPLPVLERKKSIERPKDEATKTNFEIPAHDTGIIERDKNNNHQDRSSALSKPNRSRSRSFEHGSTDRQRKLSISPARNIAAISPRAHGRQSLSNYPPMSQLQRPVVPQISNNNNTAEEQFEITRPVSRSREAAASAMLELKSAGLYRSAPVPPLLARPAPPICSTAPSETPKKLPPAPSTPKAPPTVVPLDSMQQNYKWTIGGQSYIISAAGVQSLEMLQSILMNECGSEAGKSRLMHELVKIRSLFEEKFDIEMRVRRDLEMELEHLKTNKRTNSSSEARKLIRQEIETFRQEHARKTEDLIEREDSLKMREERFRLGISRSDEERSSAEKDIRDLRNHIQKLENSNNDLRLNLVEERGKREDAESRLEEIQHSRGRTPFIMESPLSRMVRGAGSTARRTTEDEKLPPSPRTAPSPLGKKSSIQVPSFPVTSAVTSLPHGQLNGVLPMTSPTLNGIQREQHRLIDAEVPKTVVVT